MSQFERLTPVSIAGIASLVVLAFGAGPARAWDVVYPDRIALTLCQGCGITLAGMDFALLVNTGPDPIAPATVHGSALTATSSQPGFVLYPFINSQAPSPTVLPAMAIGSIAGPANAVLLTGLLPGESHLNTFPIQLIAFQVDRMPGNTYVGPVVFDITWTMGGERAMFAMPCDVALGPHDIRFTSAARTSSVPLATPVATTSWGRLRALYR